MHITTYVSLLTVPPPGVPDLHVYTAITVWTRANEWSYRRRKYEKREFFTGFRINTARHHGPGGRRLAAVGHRRSSHLPSCIGGVFRRLPDVRNGI